MSLTWVLSLLCCLAGTAYGAEVCFSDLGCFNDQPPWGGTPQRPATRLPWDPEKIGTRFFLFTSKNNKYYQEIKADEAVLKISNYSGYRKTVFIIHGYLAEGEEEWTHDMCKTILKSEGVNCIAVEWKMGVKTEYAQAANNARVVGAQVAHMTNLIMTLYKQKADKFHIIGHSMGAHAAGHAGSVVPGLARITGLDPVEQYFEACDASVRLDTSDATFVDVIHSDGLPFLDKLGLGMSDAIGHIDFYPNGGEIMPGCSKNKGKADLDAIWQGTSYKKFDACNHIRSYQYYSDSVAKPNGFTAYPCGSEASFDAGLCFPCAANATCPLMGHRADRFTVTDGISKTKFFLNTGSIKPFGRYSYHIKLTLDGPSWPNPGMLFVTLSNGKTSTDEYKLHVGVLNPGRVYEMFIDAETDVGDVTEVKFRWNNHIINVMRPQYGASKIELVRGADKKIYNFCGTETVRENTIQSVLLCQVEA